MLKNSKTQKGFTIIEVLIVLAIAGLILLIVFLAVPALQRNSRNTSIKNDVQNVIGGVAEFQAANNGRMPTSVTGTGTIDYTGTGLNATSINVQDATQVTTPGGALTATTAAPASGIIAVYIGYKCNASASSRAVAALYQIETTSGTVRQCAES